VGYTLDPVPQQCARENFLPLLFHSWQKITLNNNAAIPPPPPPPPDFHIYKLYHTRFLNVFFDFSTIKKEKIAVKLYTQMFLNLL
jgi:hypothetical protein